MAFFYTTKPGDTLSLITQKYYGSISPKYWGVLHKLNQDVIGPNPNQLRAGVRLMLPPQFDSELRTSQGLTTGVAKSAVRVGKDSNVMKDLDKYLLKKPVNVDWNKLMIIGGIGLLAASFFLLGPQKKTV